jgi:cell fate regulator YaaT (PSP1 superfamily)
MKAKMPRDGQTVTTPMGFARVVGSNPLKETVVVELETQVTVELPITDVKVVNRPMPINRPEPINPQEIKEPKENIVPPEDKGKSPN